MDEKKMMMEAKILKSFLNDFNHIPEMEKGVSIEIEAEPKEEDAEMKEGKCSECGKEPCECEGDGEMKSSKPLLDKMLKS